MVHLQITITVESEEEISTQNFAGHDHSGPIRVNCRPFVKDFGSNSIVIEDNGRLTTEVQRVYRSYDANQLECVLGIHDTYTYRAVCSTVSFVAMENYQFVKHCQ